MVLFILQVDVVGSHHQLQFQCLERCPADNHLDVKQGRLTIVNPLCKLLVPACHLLDDFVNVILIDVPFVSGDIVLRAVNQHDIQNIARGFDELVTLLCDILSFHTWYNGTVFRAVGVDDVRYLVE